MRRSMARLLRPAASGADRPLCGSAWSRGVRARAARINAACASRRRVERHHLAPRIELGRGASAAFRRCRAAARAASFRAHTSSGWTPADDPQHDQIVEEIGALAHHRVAVAVASRRSRLRPLPRPASSPSCCGRRAAAAPCATTRGPRPWRRAPRHRVARANHSCLQNTQSPLSCANDMVHTWI